MGEVVMGRVGRPPLGSGDTTVVNFRAETSDVLRWKALVDEAGLDWASWLREAVFRHEAELTRPGGVLVPSQEWLSSIPDED